MALHAETGQYISDQGSWLDIGSKETLEEADKIFQQFAR